MKTIKTLLPAMLLAAGLMITGCGDKKSVEIAKKLKTDTSLDGKPIELIGSLELGRNVTIQADSTIGCVLVVGGGDDIETVGMNLKFGKSKNSVFIDAKPDGTFNGGDIEIYSNDGDRFSGGGTVKIKAIPHYSTTTTPRSSTPSVKLSDIIIEKNK